MDRRRPIHLAVTANPTAEWTTRQLLEAFPWDSGPRYLLRDRDGCYGEQFHEATGWLGIREGRSLLLGEKLELRVSLCRNFHEQVSIHRFVKVFALRPQHAGRTAW
jgi:hypothetical protein